MKSTEIETNVEKLMEAQKLIGEAFGEDWPEALQNSPDRFARWQMSALGDARKAYDPNKVKLYPIENGVNNVQLVTLKVTAYSSCEHHYAPAWLKATIGYQPDKNFIGYSKIAKMFKFFACKYTMDERICNDFIAEFNEKVKPKGVGVIMRGKHFCVISRGGNESDFPMMSAFSGALKDDRQLRDELYTHATTSWDDGI
jgi:GTP cyclohydrolase IA